MKTLFRLLCLSIVSIGALPARAGTTLLTFDDLSSGSSYTVITNGYGGLQWLGFAALAPVHFPGSTYNLGLESGTNLAFNFDEFDRRAYISSLSPFTANSAYLTSVQGGPLQIEVQGFIGSNLAYDHTYALAPGGPTLVNLNYAGVTKLEFLPQQPGSTYVSDAYIFAMDNLSVTLAPEPATWALLATGAGLIAAWYRRKVCNRGD